MLYKATKLISSIGLLAKSAEAVISGGKVQTHPFVGEHREADIVHRDDESGFSMRIKHKEGKYNKYERFMERKSSLNGRDQVSSTFDMLWELMFTKEEESQIDFDQYF